MTDCPYIATMGSFTEGETIPSCHRFSEIQSLIFVWGTMLQFLCWSVPSIPLQSGTVNFRWLFRQDIWKVQHLKSTMWCYSLWKLVRSQPSVPIHMQSVSGDDKCGGVIICVKWSEVKSLSRVRLFATPWTVAHQAPWSVGFPRHEYWSVLPFPSPGDLPDPGIEPRSPAL